ncbi:GFA family protein [Pseudoxanthomonas sp. SGNA-20]|uniref:GFA family protein n=1 Tax=Pseudoxanthomonas sp. SGNA-20 TaxID=2493088 RepID=UPI000F644EDF|nr:GFA family protein [Pseudoxanthomonas sp. SGNA-20]RRN57397.1 GFA family protein [Pseudoxanthomonas sp. SGNA-20]
MKYQGSCHCGGIASTVEGQIDQVVDCNCSMCRRRGGLLWFVPASAFELATPRERLGTYLFNRKHIQHHFCPTCGIAPFGEGTAPDGTATVAINVRCLPEVDLDALKVVRFDGASV